MAKHSLCCKHTIRMIPWRLGPAWLPSQVLACTHLSCCSLHLRLYHKAAALLSSMKAHPEGAYRSVFVLICDHAGNAQHVWFVTRVCSFLWQPVAASHQPTPSLLIMVSLHVGQHLAYLNTSLPACSMCAPFP